MQCPVQGADIPDIKLIIQFGIPSSLSVWNQRAGRAGHAANIHTHAILLVEKSMFKRKKKVKLGGKTCTKKPDESSSDESSCESDSSLGSGSEFEGIARSDNQKVWVKKVDDDLRQYITTKDCRDCVNDAYFDNPPRTVGKLFN
jgi:bloom syndrome protein